MTTKAHADASPSSSSIWLNCSASVTQARGKIRLPTSYTREGTAAHTVAEMLLRGKRKIPKQIIVDGEEVTVTEEMRDAVDIYVAYVFSLKKGADQWHIETRVDLGYDDEDISGTSDCFAVYEKRGEVEVVDFKYGQGYLVDPGSSQNRIYGLGVLNHVGPFVDIKTIRLTIVQPRTDPVNPVKTIVLPVQELIQWESDVLLPAVALVAAGDTAETPGDHCRWCVRAGECWALADMAQANAKVAFGELPPDPTGMSSEEIGAVLEHATMIVSWLKKLQSEASQRIDHGQQVPGWKLVAKRAVRRWEDEQGAIKRLVDLGINPEDILRIETIGTVEKVMKRNHFMAKELDAFTIKESSGSTLVSEKDGRPAIDNSAQNIFGEPVDL